MYLEIAAFAQARGAQQQLEVQQGGGAFADLRGLLQALEALSLQEAKGQGQGDVSSADAATHLARCSKLYMQARWPARSLVAERARATHCIRIISHSAAVPQCRAGQGSCFDSTGLFELTGGTDWPREGRCQK